MYPRSPEGPGSGMVEERQRDCTREGGRQRAIHWQRGMWAPCARASPVSNLALR